MFRGKSMGGGTAGNIIRTASRAVARAGSTPANRSSSPTSSSRATRPNGGSTNFHCLSSSSSPGQCPVSATNGVTASWNFCNPYCDEFEWVITEDGIDSKNAARVSDDSLDWSVPSLDEVHGAVSAIHEVFGQDNDEGGRVGTYTGLVNRVSPGASEVDWVEPCLEVRLGGGGIERVYDAFHLLQTDPSVQKMVMSVSSDKAVWDAIMSNEAVQHLRNSFYQAEDEVPQNSEESSPNEPSDDKSTNVVLWIFENTKMRVMEVIESITELMNHLFQNGNGNDDEKRREGRDLLEEKLRTSFFISIVVLLVVMVTRAHKASSS